MTGALAAIEGDLLMFLMSHASWKVTASGENMIRLPQNAQSFYKDKIFKISQGDLPTHRNDAEAIRQAIGSAITHEVH